MTSVRSALISQRFCVRPASKRWFLKTTQVTMKHCPFWCHVGTHVDSTSSLHSHIHSVGPSSVVWTWTGSAFSTNESALKCNQWSRALNPVCEVALIMAKKTPRDLNACGDLNACSHHMGPNCPTSYGNPNPKQPEIIWKSWKLMRSQWARGSFRCRSHETILPSFRLQCLMPRSHQTFRPVSTMKVLGIICLKIDVGPQT
jgi:hypothetical protein